MSLEFKNISHFFETNQVLDAVSFTAQAGQVTCLLGPSGCGKTTLLRLAAGLIPIQMGSVELNGLPLATSDLSPPPEQRPIGLVFQEGALFPHLTVIENIAFGLAKGDVGLSRATALLDQVGLRGLERRLPHTLSGGQQQRVALARALAPAPDVLLLDEPFANIDSQLRRTLREDTRAMLIEADAVAILVTHDPDEALEMADQLVILKDGHLVQRGTPDQVIDAPVTADVAKLFGNGQSVTGQASGTQVETPFGNWPATCLNDVEQASGPLELIVRPGSLALRSSDNGCRVIDVRRGGAHRLVRIAAPTGEEIVCSVDVSAKFRRGQIVSVVPSDGSVFAFSGSF